MPEAANQIKHLINNEGNKVDEIIKINEPKLDPSLFDMALFVEKEKDYIRWRINFKKDILRFLE